MTFGYFASFDPTDYRVGLYTVTFSTAGQDPLVIDLQDADIFVSPTASTSDSSSTSAFNHLVLRDVVGKDASASEELAATVAYLSFSEHMTNVMVQRAYAEGWPGFLVLYCYFNRTTLRYTFGFSGGEFTAIEFGNEPTRALFGFAADFVGPADFATGTLLPDFIILPTLSCESVEGADGFDYEPPGISMSVLSAAGHKFGITRSTVPRYRDWFQQTEVKAKVLRASAVSTHPMTHQKLFELSRCVHPFVVTGGGFDNGQDTVFRLRPDSCMWTQAACKRAGGDADDGLFDVHYRAQLLGVIPIAGG